MRIYLLAWSTGVETSLRSPPAWSLSWECFKGEEQRDGLEARLHSPRPSQKLCFNVQAFRLAAVVPISILPQPLSGRGRDRRSQSLDPR